MSDIKAGVNTERLRRWDTHFKETYLDPGLLPNALTLVYRRGEMAYQSVQGWADIEKGVPIEADSIFRIYSMTKPLTSLAFMLLVEEGKVSLNDPVSSVIPEWAGLGVYESGPAQDGAGAFTTTPAQGPMRMVDLLRHTAGLSYFIQQGGHLDETYRKLGLGYRTSLDEFMAELAQLPLEFSPGEAWHYSAATDVLGYLIGKISGIPFEDFLQQRILTPLGMHETGFQVPPEKTGRFMTCYALTPQGLQVFDPVDRSSYLQPPRFVSGGGGLVSTAADYLRFCRMLLRGGELDGVRVIGPKTLELMTRNHLPGGQDIAALTRSAVAVSETGSAGVGFGLGFAMTLNPARTLQPGNPGDFYWGGAAGTYFWVDPVEDLAVIFMTQALYYPDRVRQTLRTMVYAALEDSPTLHGTKA
ncbi:serine hydrolase [Deinococcus sp.]|uniref:serine hydrolase domain-containing protein n=1 Tax=Deinococcus sp. TaxID=47478 RepID=UPI0025BCD118|nr:serine hydrolase domain-containing protein [Deinococcus sp.]